MVSYSALEYELAKGHSTSLWEGVSVGHPATTVFAEPLEEDAAVTAEAARSGSMFAAGRVIVPPGPSTLSAAIKDARSGGEGDVAKAGTPHQRRSYRSRAKHNKLGSPPPDALEDFGEVAREGVVNDPGTPTPAAIFPEIEEGSLFIGGSGSEDDFYSVPTSSHQLTFDVPEHESTDFTPLLSQGYNGELGLAPRTPTYQTFKPLLDSDGVPHEPSCWTSFLLLWIPKEVAESIAGGERGRRPSLTPPISLWAAVKAQLTVNSLLFDPVGYLPAVFLGVLMNVLDALSYGLIIFPNEDLFPASAPSAGISIFFITTFVAQVVYSIGFSRFRGANGSMMIEVIPFLHAICASVAATVQPTAGDPGEAHRRKTVLATVMVCYVLSTLATGAAFFLLGALKLGNIMSFFPRHLLIATIGGIGMFLILTGIEVTAEVPFSVSLQYLRIIFEPAKLKLWGTAAGVAALLQILAQRIRHPLFVPTFFLLVPATFYSIVFALHIPIEELRKQGWLFDLAQPGSHQTSPFEFYSFFSLAHTRWDAVLACLPTILALAFFGVLHVPINIPALSVSTGTEVDTNGELIAHGVSNMLAGLVGTIQNYLVYSNSVLFIRSGGDSRVAGLLLSAATAGVFFGGTWLVDYVPVIVVGALIFHLGFDLVRESLVDTFRIVSRFEYLTVLLVAISMPVWGFTEGILLGLVAACLSFVIQSSRRSIVRARYTGKQMWSPVHRLYRQQVFLERVGDQIRVFRLQGQVFFGTVNQLEAIAAEVRHDRHLRCLVMDFALCTALDYTAAEAFIKLCHALEEQDAYLCLAGISTDSAILQALDRVGMLEKDVKIFDTLDSALEFCENLLLETFFRQQKRIMGLAMPKPAGQHLVQPGAEILGSTLRSGQVTQAVEHALLGLSLPSATAPEPFNLLCSVFSESCNGDTAKLEQVVETVYRRFVCVEKGPGTILWTANSEPDGLYVIEKGQLSMLAHGAGSRDGATTEILLAGSVVGQLETVSRRPRMTTVVSDDETVLWYFSRQDLDDLVRERPEDALTLIQWSFTFVHQMLNEAGVPTVLACLDLTSAYGFRPSIIVFATSSSFFEFLIQPAWQGKDGSS